MCVGIQVSLNEVKLRFLEITAEHVSLEGYLEHTGSDTEEVGIRVCTPPFCEE